MSRSDMQRIADMLEAAAELAQIVRRGHEEFMANTILQRAAERLLEIIGEAANVIADDTAADFPRVAWRDIARLRIVLAHHYHRVDSEQVWAIASDEVPKMVELLGSGPNPGTHR
ncbi:MAG: HepT-like ribonuclease domain-containing protein [Candidatus Microthrix subdominans]|uniref:DUF86 domain-containing protein n=1 Tax=Candidatus Neomicrothrix subdominans TaxID=2954438 RepID=A0A936NBU2_9ACTN|nr:DUF86 domain-containing protein [Candidatus Microthrix sp.]MBK9296558.1 DUF86 domain-containing protein [Candidatus Microthrix subdominans]